MDKQVQAIREEIVRQKKYSRTMSDNAINGYMKNFFDGADDMCNQLLNFIDSRFSTGGTISTTSSNDNN